MYFNKFIFFKMDKLNVKNFSIQMKFLDTLEIYENENIFRISLLEIHRIKSF